jgi:ribokinase
MAHLVVIGSTNTDLVVELPTLPGPGQTVLGHTFRTTPGGKGANQAVAAARAGAQVTFISALGTDAFGRARRAELLGEGIDLDYLVEKPDATPSGVAVILVDAQGENLIAVVPGANALLTPADVWAARPAIAAADCLLVQLEVPLATVEAAVALAHEVGCPVLLNPAPMPPTGLPAALLQRVQVLTPNAGELHALRPTAPSPLAGAQALLTAGPTYIVVTQGSAGALAVSAAGAVQQPAFPAIAIDTVGAGDCFSACLGVALAEGQPLAAALRFAAAGAALCTTVRGAQVAMPTRGAIEALLRHAG